MRCLRPLHRWTVLSAARRIVAIAALALSTGLVPAALLAAPARTQVKILVVYSQRRDTQLPILGDRLFPKLLQTSSGIRPDYYAEYIDVARFSDPEYREAFRHYLDLKYSGSRFDVIVTTHDLALEYVAGLRDRLFPGVPLVFLSQDPAVHRPPNSAGVVIVPDYASTLRFALQLHPDTSEVFVVSGSSDRDQVAEAAARAQFATINPVPAITFLSGLSTDALEQRISRLPEHTLVYYLLFYQDAAGVNVNPLDYLDRLAAIANRPIYSWADSTLGRGVVGGDVVPLESEIRAVGDLAARVLNGQQADAIPLTRGRINVPQADWRQLRRWAIDESRLPFGTVVLFREPGILDRYRGYVIAVAAVVLAQMALITGLVVQARRRRRAEARARNSEAQLRASYDRVRDLSARLLTAQEAERTRIARELHDDIGQQLTLLAIDLDLLNGLERQSTPEAERFAVEVTSRARGIARSVHDISYRLHPPRLRLVGLVGALESLVQHVAATDVAIVLTHEDVPEKLPTEAALSMYRIAQEAVQNAIKYARARQIGVRIAGTMDGLSLTVTDDGIGFDLAAADGKGLGLSTMRERLEPFDGALHIQSEPGFGTRVEAIMPLPENGAFRSPQVLQAAP